MILNTAYAPPATSSRPRYTYTRPNNAEAPYIKYDGDNWEMYFPDNCNITFQYLPTNVDICIIAGGKPGSAGTGNTSEAKGGNGGKGGAVNTYSNVHVNTGQVLMVEVGRSGGTSAVSGAGVWPALTAESGGGANGGTGALHSTVTSPGRQNATAGSNGAYAFGDDGTGDNSRFFPGYKYGAGGGGGSAFSTLGGNTATASDGGTAGGGDGGTNTEGEAGAANSGSGGGGGASYHWNTATEVNYAGGKGGSGCVFIRNHRA